MSSLSLFRSCWVFNLFQFFSLKHFWNLNNVYEFPRRRLSKLYIKLYVNMLYVNNLAMFKCTSEIIFDRITQYFIDYYMVYIVKILLFSVFVPVTCICQWSMSEWIWINFINRLHVLSILCSFVERHSITRGLLTPRKYVSTVCRYFRLFF